MRAVTLPRALLAATLAGSITLIELHGPEGQRFSINPMYITTLRAPLDHDLKYFSHGAHCIVVMVSGKFVAVKETCAEVERKVGFRSPM